MRGFNTWTLLLLTALQFTLPKPSLAQVEFGAGGAYGEFDLSPVSSASNSTGQISSTASTGNFGQQSFKTDEASQELQKDSRLTRSMHVIPKTALVPLDQVFGGGRRLPVTTLDSFVRNSAGSADQIYGDESTDGPPPFFTFTEEHRIERGIHSANLTTGHRSELPEAWGWPQ